MKRLTKTGKALAFSLFSLLLGATVALCADPSLEQSIDVLGKHRTRERTELVKRVLARANEQPAFRTELINRLAEGINSHEENYKGAKAIIALRELNAIEALPHLRKRWEKIAKKTYYLEKGDPRIQLLRTISEFLPEKESIQFLIDTEQDNQEAPTVRFRATVLLCASGNRRAIQHVLSVYEESKRKYPTTTWMPLKDQNERPARKQEWDQDADMMNDFFEHGLLLDPTKADTDGDGILDGNDRNPLTVSNDGMSEDKKRAQFIFFVYSQYLKSYATSRPEIIPYRPRGGPDGPFPFDLWIVSTVDNYDGKGIPSIFRGLEFSGVNGIVIALNSEQGNRFRNLHGWWSARTLSIHRGKDRSDGRIVY